MKFNFTNYYERLAGTSARINARSRWDAGREESRTAETATSASVPGDGREPTARRESVQSKYLSYELEVILVLSHGHSVEQFLLFFSQPMPRLSTSARLRRA